MNGLPHQYAVYGETLASALPFPELRAVAAAPDVPPRWRFRTTAALPPRPEAELLGRDGLYAQVEARLYRHAAGHRIEVDDTGRFEIGADLGELLWEEKADAWPDFVRAHLLGRVLATTHFLAGLLPLHGSAVATPSGVIGFLAPKGFGKSTLALALMAAGARLVTDDTLPVVPGTPVTALPGVHSLRLRADALAATGIAPPETETREGKRLLQGLEAARLQERAAPLAALYLLDPAPPDQAAPTRAPFAPVHAAIGIVAHVKIGRMLGAAAAGPMLARATEVVRTVPVHRLRMPRDLARLGASAATILGWHA